LRSDHPDLPRAQQGQREFFIDNLLDRIHFIIVMIWWTGLAPWVFEFFFQVAVSTFRVPAAPGGGLALGPSGSAETRETGSSEAPRLLTSEKGTT